MITGNRVPLSPQPKYGKPFQCQGEQTGVFVNQNPAYPKHSNRMFSYSWRVPSGWDPWRTRIEKTEDGVYEWVKED